MAAPTEADQELPDAAQDLPPEADDLPDRPICGFWARVLALIVDGVILGIAGSVLGLLFGGVGIC